MPYQHQFQSELENKMDILLGILLILLGSAITTMGIQVFFTMLPLLGFLFGFFIGATGVEAILGDRFLGTVTGWIVGAVVGIGFALISWLWWYVGVLMSAGASGAVLATGLVQAIGINSNVVLFLFSVAGAALLVWFTIALNLPMYFVIVNTAMAGASVAVAGALLVFNRVDYQDLGYGTAVAIVNESWMWVLAWAVVVGIGVVRQLTLVDSVRLPDERWAPASSAPAAS